MTMAGNTKLMGFGTDGTVELQRWGGRAPVELPPVAIEALRKACYEILPKNPPQRVEDKSPDFEARYSEDTGLVCVSMRPHIALLISKVLEGVDQDGEYDSMFAVWVDKLATCFKAHQDYIGVDEPGVGG
jgi:hypothetical protein